MPAQRTSPRTRRPTQRAQQGQQSPPSTTSSPTTLLGDQSSQPSNSSTLLVSDSQLASSPSSSSIPSPSPSMVDAMNRIRDRDIIFPCDADQILNVLFLHAKKTACRSRARVFDICLDAIWVHSRARFFDNCCSDAVDDRSRIWFFFSFCSDVDHTSAR